MNRRKIKRSYLYMFIFLSVILLFTIFNALNIINISGYYLVSFLFFFIFLFEIIFGFEKSRERYVKDVFLEMFIFLLIFFVLYYLLGLVIGFIRTGNYFNLYGFFTFIIPTIMVIIFKEYLRYGILCKVQYSKILLVYTVIVFIFLDVSNGILISKFDSFVNIFKFIALYLLPSISTNIAMSYISLKFGYKPVLFYVLIMNLYLYLFPIVPDVNDYLKSVIGLLLPIMVGLKINKFVIRDDDRDIPRNYKSKMVLFYIFSAMFSITLIYLISGYFRYYALAIVSGSMHPVFERGSVVILDQKADNYDIGDIIAYRENKSIVVHRIVKYDDKKDVFYTKGDANKTIDDVEIKRNMIVGVVKLDIPYIGYPTVLLSELR